MSDNVLWICGVLAFGAFMALVLFANAREHTDKNRIMCVSEWHLSVDQCVTLFQYPLEGR